MATEQIKVTTTSTMGSTSTKSISYTNPDASNEQLMQLGKKLTALTDNTYGKTDRVITINCDTEGGGSKQTATITLTTSTITLADLKSELTSSSVGRKPITGISYDGDGNLYVYVDPDSSNASGYVGVSCIYTHSGSTAFAFLGGTSEAINNMTAPFNVIIRADETDNYKAATATFTVTA